MIRTADIAQHVILGSFVVAGVVTLAVSQGQLPAPGAKPAMTPSLIPPPGPDPPTEWSDPWYHSFCLPVGSCSSLAFNPCIPNGGCEANSDDNGFPLVSTWCDASYLMSACGGGWAAFADCEQTGSAAPTCGNQWSGTCACNGTLQSVGPTGMLCARPMCRAQ